MAEEKKSEIQEKEVQAVEKTADVKVDEKPANTEKTEKTQKTQNNKISESSVDNSEPSVIAGKISEIDKENNLDKTQITASKGKKKKKVAPFLRGGRGQVHIKATYNNTIVTITDLNGAVLVWSSAGKCGFKGPKKATPYAAGVIVRSLLDKVKELGIKELDSFLKNVGTGREAAVRAFETNGIKIVSIKDVTPIPHGGCRPKKKRRV
ncbi:30S ribosomal protein S11 [Patescibacteria group bacterium]